MRKNLKSCIKIRRLLADINILVQSIRLHENHTHLHPTHHEKENMDITFGLFSSPKYC